MHQSFFNPPSAEKFQSQCHGNIDRWLPAQIFFLATVLTAAAFVVFGVTALLADALALLMDNRLGSFTAEAIQDGLQSTIVYATCTAIAFTFLAIYGKFYLRSQFGRPAYCSELQADLRSETVMEICQAYLRHQAAGGAVLINSTGGRLVALTSQNRLSTTYIEITTMAMDKDRTYIVVRGMSVVRGKAALLSAFFNDLGACREAAGRMTDVFSAYASQRMRKSAARNKPAVPAISLLPAHPPRVPSWPTAQDAKEWTATGSRYTYVSCG